MIHLHHFCAETTSFHNDISFIFLEAFTIIVLTSVGFLRESQLLILFVLVCDIDITYIHVMCIFKREEISWNVESFGNLLLGFYMFTTPKCSEKDLRYNTWIKFLKLIFIEELNIKEIKLKTLPIVFEILKAHVQFLLQPSPQITKTVITKY